jgi:hypothetical protein
MKKLSKKKALFLSTEKIRTLDDAQIMKVVGAHPCPVTLKPPYSTDCNP